MQNEPMIPKLHDYLGSVDWPALTGLVLWLSFIAVLSFTFSNV